MCVSKPKIPTPTPVVERQAYKNAPSRGSLSTGDSEARRRLIAGVATSAQGVTSPASTTKRVRAGGDQNVTPVLGGAPSTGGVIEAGGGSTGPTMGAQTGTRKTTTGGGNSFSGIGASRAAILGLAAQAARVARNKAA